MMCSHCEAHVKTALEAVPGVELAEADHEKGIAKVKCEAKVSDDVLKAAIESEGYKVI